MSARPATSLDALQASGAQLVLAEVARGPPTSRPTSSATAVRSNRDEILRARRTSGFPVERQRFVDEMLEDSLGFGPLESLLSGQHGHRIMCNAYDEVWLERQGRIERSDIVFNSPEQYRRIIERMVAAVGRRVDEFISDGGRPAGRRITG